MDTSIRINAQRVELHFHSTEYGQSALLTAYEAAEISPRVDAPSSSAVPASRWHASGESVEDAKTALVWSANDLPGGSMTHADAVAAVAAYRGDGHSDWRLPTRAELLTLVDDTRSDPAIDTSVFPTCKSSHYWTSSAWADSPKGCAWIVSFYYGYADGCHRGNKCFVRAVRSVSPGQ